MTDGSEHTFKWEKYLFSWLYSQTELYTGIHTPTFTYMCTQNIHAFIHSYTIIHMHIHIFRFLSSCLISLTSKKSFLSYIHFFSLIYCLAGLLYAKYSCADPWTQIQMAYCNPDHIPQLAIDKARLTLVNDRRLDSSLGLFTQSEECHEVSW